MIQKMRLCGLVVPSGGWLSWAIANPGRIQASIRFLTPYFIGSGGSSSRANGRCDPSAVARPFEAAISAFQPRCVTNGRMPARKRAWRAGRPALQEVEAYGD